MQPQKYERTTDFTEREGDDTDHAALNQELDSAALSINEIRDNLAKIQRDDGALANGVVTADSLDPSAFDAVQASVNAATQIATDAAESAIVSATTANLAKEAAIAAKVSAETARDASQLNAAGASASATSALASQNAAATSEANADTSEAAALSSKNAAAASATSASASATTATTQSGISTTKASESASSASASAASAATATTKATESANSADAALTSKNAAASSASAAASSQTSAAASATTATEKAVVATTKAAEASDSAASALASKNAAAASQTDAANSKTAAAASESSASASASTATTQAGISTTKASESAASAVSAAASAAAAATALDNFDDRYLGSKTADPTVDNDGNALITGALYFNSTSGKMRTYTGSGWIDASSASVATLATFNFIATAGQTTFSGNDANGVALTYTVGALIAVLNGAVLKGNDFTASNGSSFVLAEGAGAGHELVLYAFGNFQVADTYSQAAADARFVQKDSSGNQSNLGVIDFGKGNATFGRLSTNSTNIFLADNTVGYGSGFGVNSPSAYLYLQTYGTERMRIDSSGRVTMPYQPLVTAYRNSTTLTPSGSDYVCTSVLTDVGGNYNTSNGRFTAPVSGNYSISFATLPCDSAGNAPTAACRFDFYKNGARVPGVAAYVTGSNYSTMSATMTIPLSAGDYLTVRCGAGYLYSDNNSNHNGLTIKLES